MTPELQEAVEKVKDAIEEAGAAANTADPRLTFEAWRRHGGKFAPSPLSAPWPRRRGNQRGQ
jgi:hypothetical protein